MGTQRGEKFEFAAGALNQARLSTSADGAVHHVAAAAGMYFEVNPTIAGTTSADVLALAFVRQHAKALGIDSDKTRFSVKRITRNKDVYNVRLAQKYDEVPVYGGEVMVHVLRSQGIVAVLSDIMRNTADLDAGRMPTVPVISEGEAGNRAITAVDMAMATDGLPPVSLKVHAQELVLFDRGVVKDELAPPRTAWRIVVVDSDEASVAEAVFVDAQTEEILYRVPLIQSFEDRKIYDAYGSIIFGWGTLKRVEDQDPVSQAEVNLLYDRIGEARDFYLARHGRSSYNGTGCDILATARHVPVFGCPNALYNGIFDRFGFCTGMVVDDIVAHEFTHGVTAFASQLEVGATESGAINESFSDIWGEFVDLAYGTDQIGYEWMLGEGSVVGVTRSMANPNSHGQPAVYQGDYWDAQMEPHVNSGVGNKLCHLLAAGDPNFGGSGIAPLADDLAASMSATLNLYYEVQTNRLLPTSNYHDLGSALNDATVDACLGIIDLGDEVEWDAMTLQRVVNAILAIGIGE